ncbi:hypothetical protein BGZ51_002886 [Haplosporangium sp. Z 767]|nr:hypothetical protein BGZ51_002886 [Haplosporangium sp. Z 767]
MSTPHNAGPQGKRDWRRFLNKNREGVAYFEAQEHILLANPVGYFEHRCMTIDNKQTILSEWRNWMDAFRDSEYQALRDLARVQRALESDATAYLTNTILVDRKVELLEISKNQLNQNGHEMTELLNAGKSLTVWLPIVYGTLVLPTIPAKITTAPPPSTAVYEDTHTSACMESHVASPSIVKSSTSASLSHKRKQALEVLLRTNEKKRNTSLKATRGKKRKEDMSRSNALGAEVPSSVSESKKNRRTERFQRLNESRFWRLSSGKCVEKVLFEASLTASATIKIRSYTIDLKCPITKGLFSDKDWDEIERQHQFVLPELPVATIEYLLKVKQAMIDFRPMTDVPLPVEDSDSCELILDTFRVWQRLYRKTPSPFVVHDLTEAFWGRKSWPLLMELLDGQDNLYMIDGEKAGLESSKRKNQGRQWRPDTPMPRKQVGRKLDLITRDVLDKKDWMIVERMKNWDEKSTKFLKESGYDLFRETHTIMSHRLQDTMNRHFENEVRFFGLYTGDRGFQSFELRPAGAGSYVSLFKEYPIYELPTSMADMKAHVQGIVHLLQLRKCMIDTIESYRRTEQNDESGSEEEQDQDLSWVYGNSRGRLDAETTLASSPIASPVYSGVSFCQQMEVSSREPSPEPLPGRSLTMDGDGDDLDLYEVMD